MDNMIVKPVKIDDAFNEAAAPSKVEASVGLTGTVLSFGEREETEETVVPGMVGSTGALVVGVTVAGVAGVPVVPEAVGLTGLTGVYSLVVV